MGQQSHAEEGKPPAPPLLRPGAQTEAGADEHPSAAHPPEEQTVPELIDAVADKMDTLVEEAKKLLQQLRDR